MSGGELTPPGSGGSDPGEVRAPTPTWGPAPRRWIPDESWSAPPPAADTPGPRRSALSPLPEDDDEPVSAPRRSALSPLPEDDVPPVAARRTAMSPLTDEYVSEVGARRSALSPLPDDDTPEVGARRSAMSPLPEDDTPEVGARRSALSPLPDDDTPEVGARRSALSPLPDDETPEVAARWIHESPPPEDAEEPTGTRGWGAALDVATTTPPRRSVQPALPDLGPPLVQTSPPDDPPVDAASPVAPTDPSVQPTLPDLTPTPSWPPAHSWPPIPAPDAALFAPISPAASPSDDDHALYRRPAPGEPETQWEMTPISAASPPEPPAELETTILPAIDGSGRRRRAKPARQARVRAARRHPWRDHKRLFTIVSIVVALLMVVGVGGYFLSRYNPTVSAITQGDLTLPLTAGDYRRDPSQGVSPSVHPDSKVQTVSATYSINGVQQFLVIAYRPQTDPEAALQEIQARSVTKVTGGACGHTTDMALACVVISGTTAVLAVTLVDQTPDELIDSAQKVADGLGKS